MIGIAADPLAGVTETLIADNEIAGGTGHGIDIHGSSALIDLVIAGNAIAHMAGAGIALDEAAVTVGVTIADNRIADCSRRADLTALTAVKGGLHVATVGLCRIAGNQVLRCGRGQESFGVFGIDIDGAIDVSVIDNTVTACGAEVAGGSGGVRLQAILGDGRIIDNQVSGNRGVGLLWRNNSSFDNKAGLDPALLATLAGFVNLYLGRQPSDRDTAVRGIVQGNQIELPANAFSAALHLDAVPELQLADNTLTPAPNSFDPVALVYGSTTLQVTANRFDALIDGEAVYLDRPSHAVVVGNLGGGVRLVGAPGASVQVGLNSPSVSVQ